MRGASLDIKTVVNIRFSNWLHVNKTSYMWGSTRGYFLVHWRRVAAVSFPRARSWNIWGGLRKGKRFSSHSTWTIDCNCAEITRISGTFLLPRQSGAAVGGWTACVVTWLAQEWQDFFQIPVKVWWCFQCGQLSGQEDYTHFLFRLFLSYSFFHLVFFPEWYNKDYCEEHLEY